jgi:trehalose-phosphatase
VLEDLNAVVGWLVVVSGRERSLLAGQLPADILTVGSYGLELPQALEASGHPPGFDGDAATASLETARRLLQEMSAALPGTRVEAKRWGLVLHFRAVPEVADDRENWRRFRGLAFNAGLTAVEGRQNFEMKPRQAPDKGWVIDYLVRRLTPSAATFTGDDLGDVPAWDRLRQLSPALPTLAVGVGSAEAPAVMDSVCDLVLPDRSLVLPLCEGLLQLARA